MKKTLIALMALASVAAAAEPVVTTYPDMLANPADWTQASARGRALASIEDGIFYNDSCGWGQDYATYTFGTPVVIKDDGDTLDIGYNLSIDSTDAAVTVTLIDSTNNKALTFGMGNYNDYPGVVKVGTSEVLTIDNNNIYNFQNSKITSTGTGITASTSVFYTTIAAQITMTDGEVKASVGEGTVSLGKSFTADKVLITYDCDNRSESIASPRLSSLQAKFTDVTPEPATATLSLLALAGLAARRRRH